MSRRAFGRLGWMYLPLRLPIGAYCPNLSGACFEGIAVDGLDDYRWLTAHVR